MSKRATATLSHLVESASEDEFQQPGANIILTPNSAIENIAPAERQPGRPKRKAAPTTKARATLGRVNGGSTMPTTTAATRKKRETRRAVLAEKPNPTAIEDIDDLDDMEDEGLGAASIKESSEPVKATARRGRPANANSFAKSTDNTKHTRQRRGKAGAAIEQEEEAELEVQPKLPPQASAGGKKTRVAKRASSIESPRLIPETQQEPELMDIDVSPEEEDVKVTSMRKPSRGIDRASSGVRQRPPASIHRRPGSVSDAERSSSDAALRRKLGDLTKKFDSLDLKYRNLREVGMREAESNFDRLKKASDERAKAQDDLIASLKRELSIQKTLGSEAKALQDQVVDLTSERDQLMSETKTLSKSLLDAQSETKALSAKLAAARAAPPLQRAESMGPKGPGSAVKNGAQRPPALSSSEAAKEARRTQLKEELYRDLTGLVILGVKLNEDEIIYDCIQTGRNGTLHFHLSIASQEGAGKGMANYEESEFEYTPLLNQGRDGELLEILPDCLKEEICFPGNQAAKFYIRIFDSMTKRIDYEE